MPVPKKSVETTDITPTLGLAGNVYNRFAESGKRKAADSKRKHIAKAMASAQALSELLPWLSEIQKIKVAVCIARELTMMGYDVTQ